MMLIYTISWLPFRVQLTIGRLIGRLALPFSPSRRHIVETNIRLCFPELSQQQRKDLVRKNFESTGIGIMEMSIAWFWPRWRLKRIVQYQGLEHLENRGKQGALLLSMHFTTLEIGASLLGLVCVIDGMYRVHKNPLFDYVQRRGRERYNSTTGATAISRRDIKTMLRRLRTGHAVWYAPDQDYGKKHSTFATFFGNTAATVTATSRFARLGKAQVIPFTQTRLPNGKGYKITIHPPLENFPTDDEQADAQTINNLVEMAVRTQPEQYLWAHRRFKTRPPGESRPY